MERNKEKKNNKEDEFIKREINNNDKELNTENKNITSIKLNYE